ncbi:lipopolysaccharide transport periplasmic protein LptA [Shewanella sp. YIC-542]|uniref:lipopolysaccharide transport periplasmic protein LptA n=1 Tax=Shewanella mytili TaxID=3377111 RepID=UPI00398E3A1D
MKPNKLFLGALLSLASLSAAAIDNDLLQQVKINADTQDADIKNKQVVYVGHVTVTQGSMKLTAQELNASNTDKNGERILVAKGSPATFRKQLEDGRIANASANEIHYHINKRVLTLIGNAKVEQDGSLSTAEKIVYDLENQQLQATSSGHGNDRVTTVIQPDNYQQDGKTGPRQEQQ